MLGSVAVVIYGYLLSFTREGPAMSSVCEQLPRVVAKTNSVT